MQIVNWYFPDVEVLEFARQVVEDTHDTQAVLIVHVLNDA